jgi:hypothetical protein
MKSCRTWFGLPRITRAATLISAWPPLAAGPQNPPAGPGRPLNGPGLAPLFIDMTRATAFASAMGRPLPLILVSPCSFVRIRA